MYIVPKDDVTTLRQFVLKYNIFNIYINQRENNRFKLSRMFRELFLQVGHGNYVNFSEFFIRMGLTFLRIDQHFDRNSLNLGSV